MLYQIVGVSDGDTLTCLMSGNRQVKVRLHQIDAPEKGQDFGNAARQKLSSLVFNKVVKLKTQGTDRYGRTIAEVFINGQNINKEMVKTGYAWAYREYVKDNQYIVLENEAKAAYKGLWSQPNPIKPSDFRRGTRANSTKPIPTPVKQAQNGHFSCSGKRFCREMTSCAEAKFYLNKCGVKRLDGDNDGIPCESIC